MATTSGSASSQPATIEVKARDRGDQVEVTVLDRGAGIDAQDLPKIFRPFFSTKLDHGGTGLGLSISYEIIRRHGGELRAENRASGGCRLSIILPKTRPVNGRILLAIASQLSATMRINFHFLQSAPE